MDIKQMRLDRRIFKKAIVSICKAVPASKKIRMIIKKGSTDMVILASQGINYSVRRRGLFDFDPDDLCDYSSSSGFTEENYWKYDPEQPKKVVEEPAFWVYAILHDVEDAESMNLLTDGKTICSRLKEVICNGNQKVHIKKNNGRLNLFFGDGPEAVRENLAFTDMKEKDELDYLSKTEFIDELQVNDFSYYFRETKHAIEPKYHTYFYLDIDAENHIMVTTADSHRASCRGSVTEDVKHSFELNKPEMVRIAALFLDKAVTIRIPKNDDYLQLTDGIFTVFMPLPIGYRRFNLKRYIADPKAKAGEDTLTITAPREKLLSRCKSITSSSVCVRLTVKERTLIAEGYDTATGNPDVLNIEKNPRDKNISCGISGEFICAALHSITAPSVSITFTPFYILITDHYMSSRRLPHSLRSLELIAILKDSFHIL